MTIPYPDPPLAGATFALRPFRAEDFAAAFKFGNGDASPSRFEPVR